jgi:hypothetical protein
MGKWFVNRGLTKKPGGSQVTIYWKQERVVS